MTNRNHKVIFDTNVWISFLIGKRLAKIKKHIVNGNIKIVITEQNELLKKEILQMKKAK